MTNTTVTAVATSDIALPAHIAFLGLGSMAGAIMQGLLATRDAAAPPLKCTTKSAASAAQYEAVAGISVTSVEQHSEANRDAVRQAELVVLGVKPWGIVETLTEIAAELRPGAVVVSVAAGVPLAKMREALRQRPDVRLVRAMPNTPALIGKGVTGIAVEHLPAAVASGQGADPGAQAAAVATALFSAVGEVVVVPEIQIDALSTVSGSGPAYLFWFVEQLTAAAERLGFDPETATVLAQNTVIGAAQLLEQGSKTAAEQRAAVTSPNGTTERALQAFNAADPEAMFDRALAAALQRAAEIAAA